MARKPNPQKDRGSIAIIVDGKDEKWYIEKVRQNYRCGKLRTISIKPELPTKKSVQEQFDFAKQKINEGSSFVILILDLDNMIKEKKEGPRGVQKFNKFKDLYFNYIKIKKGEQLRGYEWMKNLLVIVNNPCLEYWFLLHYKQTDKFYDDFETSLRKELIKISELSEYSKDEPFYNNPPDIYKRLESKLADARRNAKQFVLGECENKGCSEMNLIFDYFDTL